MKAVKGEMMIQMNSPYIKELIQALEETEIGNEIYNQFDNYDAGINALVDRFLAHKTLKSQLYFIGNGGSSAIASHMAADFMKNGRMNTCSLYDNAVMTCMGNDYGYEYIFSKPLGFLCKKNDLLVAISSSGNSWNIINAIQTAKDLGAEIITFTGFKRDNRIKQMGNVNVYVPSEKYGIVESVHNLILQMIVDTIMTENGSQF